MDPRRRDDERGGADRRGRDGFARRLRRAAFAAAGALVVGGILAASASADSPIPGQSTWVYGSKNLSDPTLTYTQRFFCYGETPAGQATLYPYYVPTHGYEFEWRNSSSGGVTVTANSTATDDQNEDGIALFVTSLHIHGDYAVRVSYECQSNSPEAFGTLGLPTLLSVGTESATVSVPVHASSDTYRYWVEYGTSYAEYTQKTTPQDAHLSGSQTVEIPIPNLRPETTYHYRVVLEDTDPELPSHNPSYSGEDQEFQTSASGLAAPSPEVGELAFGATGGLRVADTGSAGHALALTPDSRSAAEEWELTDPGAGRSTYIRNVKSGRCVDVGHGAASGRSALVADRCRPGSAGQRWVQRHVDGHLRLVNAKTDEVLGIDAASHRAIQAPLAGHADRNLEFTAPDGGASRPGK